LGTGGRPDVASPAGSGDGLAAAGAVAFVRDWLTVYAGADRVMEAVLALYPRAPVYTLLYQAENFRDTRIAQHPVHASFIDRLPGGRSHHRLYFPLMPIAIEQFDLGAYETVVSLSHSVAHGVLTRADQLHISYFYTPPRYAWDLYFPYLRDHWFGRGLQRFPTRLLLHYFRLWDFASSRRPDVVVAASRYVARRVWKHYRREAHVIYPPVEVQRFTAARPREDFFVTVGRLVPYKQTGLMVDAFSRLRRPLRVIGDGPERAALERRAGPTVQLLGSQPDEVVADLLERCAAFVFAADEDFGIAPVEAQAAGAPVIAYSRGGTSETVAPGETGVLFSQQTVESLIAAVQAFDAGRHRFHSESIRQSTLRFGRERFQREFAELVARESARFRTRGAG
jgi:glycosyltransferase involved in cell wall biosynthesis